MDENTTISSSVTLCEEPSVSAVILCDTVIWLFENVLQTTIGVCGLMANSLAIPILSSKEMSSIFNRLLVLLAIFDNIYIICSLFTAIKKSTPHSEFQEYAFAYGLYQLHNFVLCGSIFLTVALALERYRAVWRPVEYHNQCVGVNPWKRVLISYLLPVVVFCTLFNIPKILEVEMIVKTEAEIVKQAILDESTNETLEINITREFNQSWAAPTDLRLNEIYVVVYANIARLFVQGIIPFICLIFLNYRIYWVMKRRRQLTNRPQPQTQVQGRNGGGPLTPQQKKANEAQQAVVLSVIVVLFFVCHTPRFILNIHEFLTLDTLRLSVREDCNIISLWALGGASIAHCLLSLNSSINFFIYAFTSSTFREVLRAKVVKITPEPILTWIQSVNCQRSSPELLEVEMKAEEVKMVVQKETLPVCTPPPAPAPLLELHHIEDEIDVTTITTKLD